MYSSPIKRNLLQKPSDTDTAYSLAARNAIQYSSILVGIFLGGWLSDSVFEPLLKDRQVRSLCKRSNYLDV
ncbi:MAG: hypothetical protein WCR02_01345 [Sphaerochaetaceae bacterium]